MSVQFASWQSTIVRTRKQDGTPVSNADRNIQLFVTRCLKETHPTIPVYGEEDEHKPSAADLRGTYWLIDPIDGTRFFEAKKNEWCISIALMVEGVPSAAIIIQPALEECFIVVRDGGVQWRKGTTGWEPFVVSWAVAPMLIVPTSLSVLRNPVYTEQARRLTTKYDGDTFSTPSVLAVLEILRGHAWGWVSLFEPWHHDIAGGSLFIEEIGGTALFANRKKLSWESPRMSPVVFARTQWEALELCDALELQAVPS
jgi:3'-phosphoadenosine 5'-phosphosulfate (PAPS) 3'-phosphatase